MNLPELIKELQKYNDGWPWGITVRVLKDNGLYRRATIIRVDSDEDGLYIEVDDI